MRKLSPLAPEFTFAGYTWPRYVATLPHKLWGLRISQASRLSMLRAKFDSPCGCYYHSPTPNGPAERSFYLDSDFMPGLRWAWADEAYSRAREWYADDDGSTTIRGLVFRLPHARGFLMGWSMGERMASAVDYSQVFSEEDEAARAADSWAESVAESEREYQAQETARLNAEDDESEEG